MAVALARRFTELGFAATPARGTAAATRAAGTPSKPVFKVNQGRPHAVQMLQARSLDVISQTAPTCAEDISARRLLRPPWPLPCVLTGNSPSPSMDFRRLKTRCSNNFRQPEYPKGASFESYFAGTR